MMDPVVSSSNGCEPDIVTRKPSKQMGLFTMGKVHLNVREYAGAQIEGEDTVSTGVEV